MIYRLLPYAEIKKALPLIIAFCNETSADLEEISSIIGRLEREETVIFIAEKGEPCGIVGGYMHGNVGIADFLYVVPEHRGRLVAGRLHAAIRRWVREYGGKKIAIFCDDTRLRMYLKIGYRHKKHIVEQEV